jgi:glycosyltransferase involved in cell wall biosynthesis
VFSLHIDTARSWRGGQNQVLLTILGLGELGHRAALVAHPDGELRRRASEGLELIPLTPRLEMDLHAGWRLARVIATLAPDVVHAHDPHGVAMAALGLSLNSRGPTPPLVAARRVDFHMKQNAFSRWKYRQVARFICASNAIREIVLADGIPEDRVAIVHEGVDIDHVRASPPLNVHAELWLPAGAPIVGNVAALVPHKGQRHLVEAAALVIQRAPDVRFVIVGEGELRPVLERQIRVLGLDKHVFLTGFRPDVLSLLRSFDLFVMSSVTEGLGTSVLDAMASGLAVVVTEAGGLPELVLDHETGRIVPPRDHRAMADAILELIRDPAARARMGAAGLARVQERFTARRMVEKTLEIYDGVIAGSRLQKTV